MEAEPKKIKFNIQLTEEQKQVKDNVLRTPVSFIIGKEGTGKTMLAVNIALDLFFRKDTRYNQIIITRPAVATEDFGYLPGDINDKIDPYMQPIYENIKNVYANNDTKNNKVQKHLEKGDIRVLPIAFTRGVTYDNAVVIIDEFQNCTKNQMQMIIGRLGKNSKIIFSGSSQQIDLKRRSDSCISLVNRLKDNEYCFVANLTKNHRHAAVLSILDQIRNEE